MWNIFIFIRLLACFSYNHYPPPQADFYFFSCSRVSSSRDHFFNQKRGQFQEESFFQWFNTNLENSSFSIFHSLDYIKRVCVKFLCSTSLMCFCFVFICWSCAPPKSSTSFGNLPQRNLLTLVEKGIHQ